MTRPMSIFCAFVVLGSGLAACGLARERPAEQAPPGVEQILPRGRIPAIVEPQFVAAGEAEVPDDAWVLGVAVDGRAKAYSLNLLNQHEVVNDRIGEKDFAAVW